MLSSVVGYVSGMQFCLVEGILSGCTISKRDSGGTIDKRVYYTVRYQL